MARMKILSVDDSFNWRAIYIPSSELDQVTHTYNENWKCDKKYELLFLSGAQKELHEFIGWGNHSYRPNRVEQIGFLAGKHYQNAANGKRMCVVYHVLPVHEAKGSAAYIEYSAEMVHNAIVRLNEMERGEQDPCELIGWFHTHPNSLPTFMSGTDMVTQHSTFNCEYNYSVVLNPHTKSWKAFRGYDAVDSECRWLSISTLDELTNKQCTTTTVEQDKESLRTQHVDEKKAIKNKCDKGKEPKSNKNKKKRKVMIERQMKRLKK